jgi:hypothetical protein
MCDLPIGSLDPMKFVQAFAAGLQAEFVDAAFAPLGWRPKAANS